MASVVETPPTFDRRPDPRHRSSSRPRPRLVDATRHAAPRTLAAIVEGEIIPRLMLAHGGAPLALVAGDPLAGGSIERDEIDAFAPLTISADAGLLLARIEPLLARGVSVETVLVDLLAPTARTLGLWWEEDRCDFIEVTMGLWRLQEVVRELSSVAAPPAFAGAGAGPRHALFAAMPGDQHDFGAIMIGELFRRDGWDAEIAVGADLSTLYDQVSRGYFDLVGLTVSCDCHSERLPSVILALRSVSLNPRLRVMVGGRVFVDDPGLAEAVGADGTAPDARTALAVAGELVDSLRCGAAACG